MKYIILSMLLFISTNSFAIDKSSLTKQINMMLNKVPSSTKYGIMIYDPLSQDTLFIKNSEKVIKPASNTKLFTTAAAFSMLGPYYDISTKFFTMDEDLLDSTINGDLYIKGFGNALFSEEDLDSMVTDLHSQGIRKITGNIIGDDSYFDSVYYRKDWIEDEYSSVKLPPVSALSINRNKFDVRLSANSKGKFTYSFSPYSNLINVNLRGNISNRRRLYVSQNINNNNYEITINGSLRRGTSRTASVNIENPPLFVAYVLKYKLEKAGIIVEGAPVKGVTPESAIEVSSQSITLQYIANLVNKNSDNFLAECLFKIVGAVYSNDQGNAFYSAQAVNGFLLEHDITNEDIALVDGSGISHFNKITVGSVVDLLEKMYLNPIIYQNFYNSLSIAGIDGTLRGRLLGTRGENNLHAKTGTLRDVIALSGYVKTVEGDELIVSIIFEYQYGRASFYKRIQDRIILTLLND